MLREEFPQESVETLCGLFDKRRQWYYEKRKVLYTVRSHLFDVFIV
jgi:hypothetical protein